MMEARKEHMVIFVQKEREEIIKLWEQMYVGEEERTGTEMMTSSECTPSSHLTDPIVPVS